MSQRMQCLGVRSGGLARRIWVVTGWVMGLAVIGALIASGITALAEGAPPANADFERTWARTDRPVADGRIARTWMWGPEGITGALNEPYAESPGGKRTVQYFDKTRMEINDPAGDRGSPFYVTNGLLVVEMVEGFYQTGDASFDRSPEPAAVNITGDPGDESGPSPTYADIVRYGLRDRPALPAGAPIVQRIDGQGAITDDPALASHGVSASERVQIPGIDHRVASVFYDFLNSQGLVAEGDRYVTARLFEPWYYASGLPITEAYWSRVLVGGQPRDVLWQCFERRCLTWTPGNPDGFQVEAGNVGQHYHRWRYSNDDPATPATSTTTPTATATVTVTVTPTATATATMPATPTPLPDVTYRQVDEFGMAYPASSLFRDPRGVAVGPDGTVYVADSGNDQLQEYTADGRYVARWTRYDSSGKTFRSPSGVAASADGRVIIADSGNNNVLVYEFVDGVTNLALTIDSDGTAGGTLNSPVGVAVDPAGRIYVADTGNNRVLVFGADGNHLRTLTTAGGVAFVNPYGVAVNAYGYVWVLDSGNGRVVQFNNNGAYLGQWGSTGSGPGQFKAPRGIAMGPDGTVYVADTDNNRIQLFSSGGAPIATWAGGLDGPYGIAVKDSLVYVSLTTSGEIRQLTTQGVRHHGWIDGRYGTFGSTQSLAVDASGRVFVTDVLNPGAGSRLDARMQVFDREWRLLGEYINPGEWAGGTPFGIAIGPDGSWYVAINGQHRIVKYDAGGSYVTAWGSRGSGPGQLIGPDGVAVDADGNVYVADTGNLRVQVFDAGGSYLRSIGTGGTGPGTFGSIEDLAVAGDRVYVTDSERDRVLVFQRSGSFVGEWGSAGSAAEAFVDPRGIALDGKGRVFVVDVGNERIQVFTLDGAFITTFGADDFSTPTDIAVHADGRVYVLDAGGNCVKQFAESTVS